MGAIKINKIYYFRIDPVTSGVNLARSSVANSDYEISNHYHQKDSDEKRALLFDRLDVLIDFDEDRLEVLNSDLSNLIIREYDIAELTSCIEELKMERERRFPYGGYLNMTCDKDGRLVRNYMGINNEENTEKEITPSIFKSTISRVKRKIQSFSSGEKVKDFLEME